MANLLDDRQKRAVQLIAAGMTYQEVAEQLGTTYTTIYRWRQKPAFKVELEKANENKATGGQNEEQMKEELDAYRRGRMDGLVMQAINTLASVMATGQNEGAKVNAAKYVLEKFAASSLGNQEENNQLEELKSMLRLVGE